jgi:hypothetical protein
MRLTLKDKDFLEKLKVLFESKELSIELKEDGVKRLVLRKNYGDKIESAFNLTRQGVRWRFQRLFSEIYVESYLAIFWIESSFGTGLRQMALEIARERVELRKKARKMDDFELCRREKGADGPQSGGVRL